MYKNNSRECCVFKGCRPLQLFCNWIGNHPQTTTFHTASAMHKLKYAADRSSDFQVCFQRSLTDFFKSFEHT